MRPGADIFTSAMFVCFSLLVTASQVVLFGLTVCETPWPSSVTFHLVDCSPIIVSFVQMIFSVVDSSLLTTFLMDVHLFMKLRLRSCFLCDGLLKAIQMYFYAVCLWVGGMACRRLDHFDTIAREWLCVP